MELKCQFLTFESFYLNYQTSSEFIILNILLSTDSQKIMRWISAIIERTCVLHAKLYSRAQFSGLQVPFYILCEDPEAVFGEQRSVRCEKGSTKLICVKEEARRASTSFVAEGSW